ncbi:MAG: B12-binding domain-containing radical SAM protein [Deltaproteobacteria bacterium]|nr:B12-binding domain-containing radical SAM protein [Deltaproteobacteria bacterium]
MKILFIAPPNFRFREVTYQNLSLGPAYLAAVLRKNHDVIVYDAEAPSKEEVDGFKHDYTSYEYLITSHDKYLAALNDESHPVWREIAGVINDFAPDIIGLSTMTPSYPAALVIARLAKRISPAKVIIGGVHATTLPEETAWQDNIDIVVRGEAEETMVELVACLEQGGDLSSVKGLTYKKDGRLVNTPSRNFISDLNKLPFPIKDVLFPERFSSSHFINIIAGRGCPHNCYFCANHSLWGAHRIRSLDNIWEELNYLYNKYDRTIMFWDDNLTVSKKLLFALCDRMKKETPDILWRGESRVDTLTPETLITMKEAGCWDVKLGIESGSDKILAYMNKKLTVKKVMDCAEMILKTGIQFSVNFMYGLPEETWDDLMATLDLIKRIPANSIAVSKFIPLPGTKLYDDVMELGLIKDRPPKYEHLDLYSTHYYYPRHVAKDKFQEFIYEINRVVDEKNKRTRIGPPKRKQIN